ncbi:hypothetical protein CDIK_3997 [Cucumispora dikerogammari]|nr:hypothetical protein CDIK_3997 [Cucumispora dikerogammari]
MLGKPQLIYKSTLDENDTLVKKQNIKNKQYDLELSYNQSIYDKKEEVYNQKSASLTEVYLESALHIENDQIGRVVVQRWQVIDTDNNILHSLDYQQIEIEVKRGSTLYIGNDKQPTITYTAKGKNLYVTARFISIPFHKKMNEMIDINVTKEMKKLLKDYRQQFCFVLNSLITKEFFFTGCKKKNVINRIKDLDELANDQLGGAIDLDETEIELQKRALDFVIVNKHLSGITITDSKIIVSPLYIPPCRLLYSPEGIGDEIRDCIKDKEFNVFGKAVWLSEGKTFYISLLFGELYR